MEQYKLEKLLTAYIDGEIFDQLQLDEIKNLIDKDQDLKFDYEIQVRMKSIVSERMKIKPTPPKVINKVIRKIKPSTKTEYLRSYFQDIFKSNQR